MVQMLDQLSILLAHPLRHAKNAFLIANDRLSEVASDKFVKAFELLDDCVSMLLKFKCGTDTIPSCPLLQAKEAKATKAKLDKALKRTANHDHPGLGLISPDTKRQQGLKPGNVMPSSNNLNGTLVYTGTNMMPTITNPTSPCVSALPASGWAVIAPAGIVHDDTRHGHCQVAQCNFCQVGSPR